jgi:cyclopropane fatty-acyl-phospholipid synthase-like methyltransferase
MLPWHLTAVLPPSSVSPSDVFVDIGSGKGRAVLLAAARYPFKRVIGVELSEDLHRVATQNVGHYEGNHGPVELVNQDVLDWQLPRDATVLFMFNPFSGSTFKRFIANVRKSLHEYPRDFRLIYLNPQMHQIVLDAGFRQTDQCGRVRLYR